MSTLLGAGMPSRVRDQAVGDRREPRAQVASIEPGRRRHAGTRWSARRSTRRSAKRSASDADRVRRVDAAGGDEDAAVDDVEVVDVVRLPPRIDDRRSPGRSPMRAVPSRCQPALRISVRVSTLRRAGLEQRLASPARRGSRAAAASSPRPCRRSSAPAGRRSRRASGSSVDAVVARRAGPRRRCPS